MKNTKKPEHIENSSKSLTKEISILLIALKGQNQLYIYLLECGLKHSKLSKIVIFSSKFIFLLPYPPAMYICPPYSAAHAPMRASAIDLTKYQQFEDGS